MFTNRNKSQDKSRSMSKVYWKLGHLLNWSSQTKTSISVISSLPQNPYLVGYWGQSHLYIYQHVYKFSTTEERAVFSFMLRTISLEGNFQKFIQTTDSNAITNLGALCSLIFLSNPDPKVFSVKDTMADLDQMEFMYKGCFPETMGFFIFVLGLSFNFLLCSSYSARFLI